MNDRPKDELTEDEQIFLHKMYQENFDADFEKWVDSMEESLSKAKPPEKDDDFEFDL